jgi:hypothetical protein
MVVPVQFAAGPDILTERQEKVAALRLHGLTLREISAEVGVTHTTVRSDLVKVRQVWRQNMSKSYDDHVAQSLARYEQLMKALKPGLEKHDWKSIDTAIRLEDRVAKLLGLDMPTQVEVSVTVEAIDKEINRLESKIIDAEVVENVDTD